MPEVNLTCLLNRDSVPLLNQPQMIYVWLEIAPAPTAAQMRLPLNVSLVLDESLSMGGAKIERLKDAVKRFINQLQPDDQLSVVMFVDTARVLIASQPARKPRDLGRKIDTINVPYVPGVELMPSGTKIACGLRPGLAEVNKKRTQEAINRIVLLTDGQDADEPGCLRAAEEAGRQGVPVIALGVGTDWNEDLLSEIAACTGGRADYIARAEDMDTVFQEVMHSLQVVACDLTVTLRLMQGVEARRVWQVAPLIRDLNSTGAIAGREVMVPLGDLEQGGSQLLFEAIIPPRAAGRYRIAQAEVAYSLRALGLTDQKARADLLVEYSPDPYAGRRFNPTVMNLVERVQAFKLQTRALEEAAAGELAGATQKLRAAVTILLNQGEAELAQVAQQEAERLEKGMGLSEAGRKTIAFKSSKTVKLNQEG